MLFFTIRSLNIHSLVSCVFSRIFRIVYSPLYFASTEQQHPPTHIPTPTAQEAHNRNLLSHSRLSVSMPTNRVENSAPFIHGIKGNSNSNRKPDCISCTCTGNLRPPPPTVRAPPRIQIPG